MLKEFRDFINKGNVVIIAVGLVMALYFQKIIDALLDGVINPIIAAIFGKESFLEIGFDIGDSRINLGLVIDALISFIVVAFILFLVVKAYNRMSREDAKGPATEVALPDPGPPRRTSALTWRGGCQPLEWTKCVGAAAFLS